MNLQSRPFRALMALGLALSLLASTFAGIPARTAQAEDAAIDAAGDQHWDNRFAIPGTDDTVTTVAVAANGDIFIGGQFTEVGNVKANHIARWDGKQFHPLGEGLDNDPEAIVTDGNDLYAVGRFTSAGLASANGIARWNGTEWSAVGTGEGATDKWGSNSMAWLHAAAIYDGRLIIGGQFVKVDGVDASNIAAWDGTSWAPLDMGIGTLDWDGNWSPEQSEVRALLSAGDTLYVGGQFGMADMVAVKSIAAWDGAQWAGVGDGFEMREDGSTNLGKVHALAYGNNTLYAGGYFNRADGGSVNYIAQHKNDAWSGLGAGVKIEQWSTDTPIDALVFADNQLYVGGNFTAAGGKAIDLIATWDGAAWNEVAGGIPDEGYDQVHALAAGPDFVVAGGYFRLMADKRVDNISILSGGEWLALGQGVHIDYGDMPGKAYAQAADDGGNIYIGGEFTRAGGVPTKNLAMWDGERWHNIGDADSYISALAVGGGFLYAGGNFTQIGGVAASHVARMNLQTGQWAPLSSGINGNVKALVYSDGILYAGGDFKAAGTVTAEDVAFWDGTTWHPFGAKARVFEVGDRGGEVGTFVNALAVVGDSVFLGGHFQTIQFGTNTQDLSSFVVVHNVVEWNRATDQWGWVGTGQKPGVTTDGFSGFGTDVYALAIVGNSLFVGGSFNQAGGMAATGGLARWDFAGSQWISIDGSLGGIDEDRVRALAPAGADLIVAGKFTSAGVAATRFIARFDTTTNKWKTLGSGLTWYNDRYLEPYSVLAIPSGIYVAGNFDQAGGKASMGFARWTGELGAPNLTPGQGGAVQAPGVKATFPAGAVGENSVATLAVTPKQFAALPEGWGGLYGLRPAVTTMSGKQLRATLKAYTLQAAFTDAQLAAAGIKDATTLQLVAWNGTTWQSIQNCNGCGVDVQKKILTGATTELLPIALVGKLPQVGQQPNVTPEEGGTVEKNGVKAVFPTGAVTESAVASLSVTPRPAKPTPQGWAGIYGLQVQAKTTSGAQMTQTAKPFTVQAPYTDAQLKAAGIEDPATMRLAVWNGQSWENISNCNGCGVDIQKKIVTGATNQLQPLAILGVVPEGQGSSFNVYMPAITR